MILNCICFCFNIRFCMGSIIRSTAPIKSRLNVVVRFSTPFGLDRNLLFRGRLFLLSLSLLFGICLRSLWSPPFPPHAPDLISLSLVKVRLSPTFTLSPLMIWYYGQTDLFLFIWAKVALAYLPTALSVAQRPLFLFQQAQYV